MAGCRKAVQSVLHSPCVASEVSISILLIRKLNITISSAPASPSQGYDLTQSVRGSLSTLRARQESSEYQCRPCMATDTARRCCHRRV